MRIYSNALERENSILFVMGFSFADEHIAKITQRAADTNPTLQIVVFAYSDKDLETYKKNLEILCILIILRRIEFVFIYKSMEQICMSTIISKLKLAFLQKRKEMDMMNF